MLLPAATTSCSPTRPAAAAHLCADLLPVVAAWRKLSTADAVPLSSLFTLAGRIEHCAASVRAMDLPPERRRVLLAQIAGLRRAISSRAIVVDVDAAQGEPDLAREICQTCAPPLLTTCRWLRQLARGAPHHPLSATPRPPRPPADVIWAA